MSVARSSSDGVVIFYVLPVLWMTSYLLISQARFLDVATQLNRSGHGLGYKLRSNTSCGPTDTQDYFLDT